MVVKGLEFFVDMVGGVDKDRGSSDVYRFWVSSSGVGGNLNWGKEE